MTREPKSVSWVNPPSRWVAGPHHAHSLDWLEEELHPGEERVAGMFTHPKGTGMLAALTDRRLLVLNTLATPPNMAWVWRWEEIAAVRLHKGVMQRPQVVVEPVAPRRPYLPALTVVASRQQVERFVETAQGLAEVHPGTDPV